MTQGQRQWKPWEFSKTRRSGGDGTYGTNCMCVTVKFMGKEVGKIYRERGMDGWAGTSQLEGILGEVIEGYPLKDTKDEIERCFRQRQAEIRQRMKEETA